MTKSLLNYGSTPMAANNYGMNWGGGSSIAPLSSSILGLQTMPDVNSMGLLKGAMNTPQTTPGMFNGMFDNFLGSTDANGIRKDGWGGMALGAAQGIGNLYMGMKQYGLAKDTLAENKRQFALNYDAQKKTTNAQLEDRQNARVAANPNAYQSVSEYMNKNRIA